METMYRFIVQGALYNFVLSRPWKCVNRNYTKEASIAKPRHRWEDNRIDFKEIGASTRNWITFLQDRNYCIIYGVT